MKSPESLEWRRIAEMDLQTADTINEHQYPKPSEVICFHCQQCVEKLLKGFLVENNSIPPKIHDLTKLCDMCNKINGIFETIYQKCDYLNNFSVLPRYPNELEIIEDDAKRALKYAHKIMQFFNDLGNEDIQ